MVEVSKLPKLKKLKKEEKKEEPVPKIGERIKQLKGQGYDNKEITSILYQEGYNTKEIMEHHLPLRTLKMKPSDDESVMGAMAGTTKGPGYLDELKRMIQVQIGRSRELTEVFYNIGLGGMLAALSKSGIGMDEFEKIALKQEGLRDALRTAGETIFKALEYYQSDLVTKVEAERDEARAYAATMEATLEDLNKELDPKLRMEKMIYTYLLSGASEPETLITLIDKWLGMELSELGKVKLEAITA